MQRLRLTNNEKKEHQHQCKRIFYAKIGARERGRGNRHQTHRKLQLHRNGVIQWINCNNLKLFNDSPWVILYLFHSISLSFGLSVDLTSIIFVNCSQNECFSLWTEARAKMCHKHELAFQNAIAKGRWTSACNRFLWLMFFYSVVASFAVRAISMWRKCNEYQSHSIQRQNDVGKKQQQQELGR